MKRRNFLGAILAAGVAPAAISSGILMPIKPNPTRVLVGARVYHSRGLDIYEPVDQIFMLDPGVDGRIYRPGGIRKGELFVLASSQPQKSRLLGDLNSGSLGVEFRLPKNVVWPVYQSPYQR